MDAKSLRELASRSGLSVRQLAAGSGVSKSSVGRFLQGGTLGRSDSGALARYLRQRDEAPAVDLPPPAAATSDDDPVRTRARQFEVRAIERAAELLEDESGPVALQAIKVILSYSRGRPGQAATDDEPEAPADVAAVREKLERMLAVRRERETSEAPEMRAREAAADAPQQN